MSVITNQIRRLISAVDRLNSFEKSEDIANFFQDLGYKGERGTADQCIVARFCKDCIGDGDANVKVSPWDVVYRWSSATARSPHGITLKGFEKNNILTLAFNTPVEKFVEQWDGECFPELIEAMVEEAKAEAESGTTPEPVTA